MRMLMFLAALTMLASSTGASAGGSADEIRKVITGRSCCTPGVTYHFGRDGKFRREENASRDRLRTTWQGTYSVSEGTILLNIASGGYVKGLQSVGTWVSGNRIYIPAAREGAAYFGSVVFECR